jgi:hypothetical protein
MDGVRMTRPALDLPILGQVDPAAISIRAGFDSGRGDGGDRKSMAVPAAEELAVYFCELIPSVILLVFLLVSAAIGDENYFKFKWL